MYSTAAILGTVSIMSANLQGEGDGDDTEEGRQVSEGDRREGRGGREERGDKMRGAIHNECRIR